MNKIFLGGIIGVVVIGAIAVFVLNLQDSSESEVAGPDTQNSITRPAVQAVPNTFSIMTPEEKAASEQAARIAAEEAAEQASSTASSTDEAEPEEDTIE